MQLCAMALLIISSAGMFCGFACAEEGGSGDYLPGATSSFIDLMPDRETSTFAYLNLRRRRLPPRQQLPLAGMVRLVVSAAVHLA